MLGLTHKPKHEAPKDIRFVVYRSRRRCDNTPLMDFSLPVTRAQATRSFEACLARRDITPDNGRRLLITGPDYAVQPEDHGDPLLIGVAAVKAVLSAQEFEAFAAQTAQYALEAE